MQARGISCKVITGTSIIEAKIWNHQEFIDGADLSLMPSNYKILFDSKWNTKRLLQENNISTAKWYRIEGWDIEIFKSTLKKLTFPLVMKPEFGTHGYEVRMNIESEEEAQEIFIQLSREIKYQNIIVEEQFPGNEFRIMVTRNNFFGCLHRPFPEVIWDSKKTIQKLIESINTHREINRVNALCRIYIDHELKRFLLKQGYNLATIPEKWEHILVRSNSNVSTGWWCHEVSELVHPFYRELALSLLDIFPKLPYIGIDIITQDISQKSEYIICELNPSPGISLHTHPESGQKKDLPKFLIDLLFPETIS